MENHKPKNNHFTLKGLLILVAIISVMIIHSCRKDANQMKQSTGEAVLANHNVNFALLKAAYSKGISSGNLKTADINQALIGNIISSLNIDWTTYTLNTYSDSTQIIEFSIPDDTTLIVPTAITNADSLKYHSKTSAVFILRGDTVNMSFFMKTIEDCSQPGYQSVINNLYYRQVPPTFNGNTLYFTLGRQYINGYQWQNGSPIKSFSFGSSTSSQQQQTQSFKTNKVKTAEVLTNCVETDYEFYSLTISNGEVTNAEYIGTISVIKCDISDGSSSGSSGTIISSSGGSVSGDPSAPAQPCTVTTTPAVQSISGKLVVDVAEGGSGGSGGTSTPCQTDVQSSLINKITDSVSNPCLKALLQALINGQTLQADVTNMLRNTFGGTSDINLTFIDGNFTNDPQIGQNDAGTDGSNAYNFEIKLNTPVIGNASQEFLLETAMHEIFHAYLSANPSVANGLSQHTYMIQNYVNTEVATLQQVFPNLSTHDAECLVLAGYGTLSSSTLNTALTSFNLTASDVAATNNNYKSGTTGTKCP